MSGMFVTPQGGDHLLQDAGKIDLRHLGHEDFVLLMNG